jgi:hypothetical protein
LTTRRQRGNCRATDCPSQKAYFSDELRGVRSLQIDLAPEMGAAANKMHQVSLPFKVRPMTGVHT